MGNNRISIVWPLIERRLSRWDCLQWLARGGFPPAPKSACIGCPYHSDAHWRSLEPDDFRSAVALEREIQTGAHHFKLRGVPFLHASLRPLDQVDLSTPEERGQLNLFNNECEGMCGV